MSAPAPLELRGLRKVFYPGTANEVVAIAGIDLEVPAGQFVSIIGSNGSGKSTLMNAVAGTFPLTAGQVVLGGVDLSRQREHQRSRTIGRVFQDPRAGTAPDMTIEENLALSLLRSKRSGLRLGVTNRRRDVMRGQLARLDMGLESRLKTHVNKLSGGQRQLHIVRDHQRRETALDDDGGGEVHDGGRHLGVERGGVLVEEQQARLGHRGHEQGHRLALPAR